MNALAFFSLLLIPVCAELNHLGGQSTVIPCPRFTCRMLGQALAFGVVAFLCGVDGLFAAKMAAVTFVGLVNWAVWEWGPGFMAINGQDFRGYNKKWWFPHFWICKFADFMTATYPADSLTYWQCRHWGLVYMTARGAFMLPLFFTFAGMLTPWAIPIGFLCLLQGIIYYTSPTVLTAEYRFGGGVTGVALAAILFIFTAHL